MPIENKDASTSPKQGARGKGRKLPPDPEQGNDERSKDALIAIAAFREATGTDACDAVSDLLSNLMHMCDRHPEYGDFATEYERAEYGYLEETARIGMYVETIEIV